METSVRARLEQALAAVEHRIVTHPPGSTAAEIAEARGTPLELGTKALLMKADGGYLVAAMPADGRLDGNRLRRALKIKRMRFASADELLAQTGLVPGCVPPWGPPVLPFRLVADPSLVQRESLAFTLGVRDRSVILRAEDWRRLAGPELVGLLRDRTPNSIEGNP